MAQGDQPSCWTCDRTRWSDEARDAIEIHHLLELDMTWTEATTTLGWTGTRDDLQALAARVAMIRAARAKSQ